MILIKALSVQQVAKRQGNIPGGGFGIFTDRDQQRFCFLWGGLNFEIRIFWLLITAAVSFWVTKLVLYS